MFIYTIRLQKYRSFFAVCSVFLLAVLTLAAAFLGAARVAEPSAFVGTTAADLPIVIIDAGHGGEDSGTIGTNGVYEKDLNLAFAKELGGQLSELGYAVVYTRTDDRLLYTPEENIRGMRKISDLKNRCQIAREHPDALFISIHMNAFAQPQYHGLQVYYGTASAESERLADAIRAEVCAQVQPQNKRAIKPGRDIYLLENIQSTAVLIECGFLSNAEECEKLSSKEYQKQLSFSVVCGIMKYESEKTQSKGTANSVFAIDRTYEKSENRLCLPRVRLDQHSLAR